MLGVKIIRSRIEPDKEGIYHCPECNDEMWRENDDAYMVFDDLYTETKDQMISFLYCDWCSDGYVFIDDVPECVKGNLLLKD